MDRRVVGAVAQRQRAVCRSRKGQRERAAARPAHRTRRGQADAADGEGFGQGRFLGVATHCNRAHIDGGSAARQATSRHLDRGECSRCPCEMGVVQQRLGALEEVQFDGDGMRHIDVDRARAPVSCCDVVGGEGEAGAVEHAEAHHGQLWPVVSASETPKRAWKRPWPGTARAQRRGTASLLRAQRRPGHDGAAATMASAVVAWALQWTTKAAPVGVCVLGTPRAGPGNEMPLAAACAGTGVTTSAPLSPPATRTMQANRWRARRACTVRPASPDVTDDRGCVPGSAMADLLSVLLIGGAH